MAKPLPAELILAHYQAGLPVPEIATQVGASRSGVCLVLQRYRQAGRITGYKSSSRPTKRCSALTDKQYQVIDGLLLGDGSIGVAKTCINASLALRSIQQQFVKHTSEILAPMAFHRPRLIPAHTQMFFNGITARCKDAFQLNSLVDKALTPVYTRWRPNGPKAIPPDLVITPTAMLYWFYGDGSTSYRARNSLSMNLATQGFTSEECDFLIQRVYSACGIKFTKHKSSNHFSIGLTRGQEIGHILNWMLDGAEPLECFRYKWKYRTLIGPLKGAANLGAKLAEQDVWAIFKLRERGWLLREIAECLPVTQGQIGAILNGRKWRHISH